jgi:hypothetical protein
MANGKKLTLRPKDNVNGYVIDLTISFGSAMRHPVFLFRPNRIIDRLLPL